MVATPYALPFIRLALILADSMTGCKRFFTVWQLPNRFFCCSEGGVLRIGGGWVARHGRGRGGHRSREQGGVRGGFRSMQFPAVGLVVACRLVPVGIASL